MRIMRCICLTTNLRVFILLFVSIFLYISLVSKSDSMLSKISQYKKQNKQNTRCKFVHDKFSEIGIKIKNSPS